MTTILISVIVPIITALLSFFASRHQANSELEKVKKQHESDLEKVKEQQKAELEKLRESWKFELQKIQTELKEQAGLYAANKETDLAASIIEKMLTGQAPDFGQLKKDMEDLLEIGKDLDQNSGEMK